MADSFRIVSGDGKTPEISKKLTDITIIEKIHTMDPATAYVAVQGTVIPTLNQLQKNFSYLSTSSNSIDLPSPMHLAPMKGAATKPPEEAYLTLQQLKKDFSEIRKKLEDLYKNRQEIINRWIDSNQSKPIKPDNQILKDFYYLRETLEKKLDGMKSSIEKFKKNMPQSKDRDNTIAELKKICDDLKSQLPEPDKNYRSDSGNWKPKSDALVDRKGKKLDDRMRFWWKENQHDQAKVMKWKDSGDTKLPKNPLGIFEMVIDADRSKYKNFLKTLSNGIDNINKFYTTSGAKSLHLYALKDMNTEAAYMYLTTVILPSLQNQSAEILEKHSETMKLVSKIYDKWNEIQDEINETTKTLRDLQEGKSIEELDITITKIEDYHRKSDNTDWKIVTIDDPKGYFNITINKKVAEFKELLKEAKKNLPSTSKELINTLDTLADGLTLEDNYDKGYYNFNWNYSGVFKFEIQTKDIPDFTDNTDFETMKKIIWDRVTGGCRFLIDSDQTKAKIYVDNVNQGFTALTSVSNITQQELQMATQYYNSLLGLQKNLIDSINKVIQLATKTPNY